MVNTEQNFNNLFEVDILLLYLFNGLSCMTHRSDPLTPQLIKKEQLISWEFPKTGGRNIGTFLF